MKELSIEQKAQRYDESIERAKRVLLDCTSEERKVVEYITPELAESEDEKIRKELVQFFEEKDEEDFEEWIPKAKVLAWLEKKGKQKETLCDKCKKAQPSHSCQDITALGRCALEKQGEQKLTEFEKAVKQVMEEAIECGDTRNLKADAEMLLSLVHKSAWSEEDKDFMYDTLSNLTELKDRYGEGYGNVGKCIDWLRTLRPQSQWKPSDEQMKVLDEVIKNPHLSSTEYNTLTEIEEQLEKLKDEK